MSKQVAGIKRGSRFFLQVKGYGEADEKGKTVLGIGCSGKRSIAPQDRPLLLVLSWIEHWLPAMHWSTDEAAQADLARFKKFVGEMEIKSPDGAPVSEKTT